MGSDVTDTAATVHRRVHARPAFRLARSGDHLASRLATRAVAGDGCLDAQRHERRPQLVPSPDHQMRPSLYQGVARLSKHFWTTRLLYLGSPLMGSESLVLFFSLSSLTGLSSQRSEPLGPSGFFDELSATTNASCFCWFTFVNIK